MSADKLGDYQAATIKLVRAHKGGEMTYGQLYTAYTALVAENESLAARLARVAALPDQWERKVGRIVAATTATDLASQQAWAAAARMLRAAIEGETE